MQQTNLLVLLDNIITMIIMIISIISTIIMISNSSAPVKWVPKPKGT